MNVKIISRNTWYNRSITHILQITADNCRIITDRPTPLRKPKNINTRSDVTPQNNYI